MKLESEGQDDQVGSYPTFPGFDFIVSSGLEWPTVYSGVSDQSPVNLSNVSCLT